MPETKNTPGLQLTFVESLRIAKQKPLELLLWLVINVFFGLVPILILVFISFMLKTQQDPSKNPIDPYKPVFEGDLFIFVTTLCAASVGVYWEISGFHFWNVRRLSLLFIIAIVAFSSGIYLLLKIEPIKTVLPFDENAVWWVSIVFLFVSVIVCLHMFAMRLSLGDMEEFANERKEEIESLNRRAKVAVKTSDGAEL